VSAKALLPLAVFAALAVVLAVGVKRSPEKATLASALIGKPAPAFSLPSLKDPSRSVTSAQFSGRPFVLNVWGTWCAECRVEHGMLLAAAAERRAPIVGLNWKDDDAAALRWLADLGDPFVAVAVEKEGRTAIDFGVYGAPETFLIDAAGRVVFRHVGALTREIWDREFVSRLPPTQEPAR
jgi:cytochrome c biogenesis protein CcmG/thiol:disulfide interchange protein DsbE